MRPPTNILEPGGRRKLALVQGTTTVASLAGPFFIRTHTGTGQDISVIGWAMTVLLKRGGGRQRKEVKKEEGRRPTRTIEKVGRKGVVHPYPPHLPRILVAPASGTFYLSHFPSFLLVFQSLSLEQCLEQPRLLERRQERTPGEDMPGRLRGQSSGGTGHLDDKCFTCRQWAHSTYSVNSEWQDLFSSLNEANHLDFLRILQF